MPASVTTYCSSSEGAALYSLHTRAEIVSAKWTSVHQGAFMLQNLDRDTLAKLGEFFI